MCTLFSGLVQSNICVHLLLLLLLSDEKDWTRVWPESDSIGKNRIIIIRHIYQSNKNDKSKHFLQTYRSGNMMYELYSL